MEVFGGEGEGFALTGEEFASDKLDLSDSHKNRLEAQCRGFVEFLG